MDLLSKKRRTKGGGTMEIGSKLKIARNDKKLTQEQAAELLGVSRQTISNWENNRSYPDIISVIKMSDIYSVSLDHLLKEEKSMDQTYRAFLEKSTNTVKAKQRLEKVILFSTDFLIWAGAMALCWWAEKPIPTECDMLFRWILLPFVLLVTAIWIAKNNYWGRGNWFAVPAAAVTFLAVPYTRWMAEADTLTYTFLFPNFLYMLIGMIVAICGIGIGSLWRKKSK